jgi:hypothetical protein
MILDNINLITVIYQIRIFHKNESMILYNIRSYQQAYSYISHISHK